MLAYQIGRQKVKNYYEMDPVDISAYSQIRCAVSDLLPQMNVQGQMQGTFLCKKPLNVSPYEQRVLEVYHETNQMVL